MDLNSKEDSVVVDVVRTVKSGKGFHRNCSFSILVCPILVCYSLSVSFAEIVFAMLTMKPIYLFILTLFRGLVCMYTTPVLFGVGMHSQQIYVFTLAMLV